MSLASQISALATRIATEVKGKLDKTSRGAANGVASLDGTSHVPKAELDIDAPDVAYTDPGDYLNLTATNPEDVGATLDLTGAMFTQFAGVVGSLGEAAYADYGFWPGTIAEGVTAQSSSAGGIAQHQRPGMDHWFVALETAKSSGTAKIQVFDDSTGEINGINSWPWQMHGILASYNKVQPAEILGTRFPNGAGWAPTTTTTAGTASQLGAGADSCVMAPGGELTQTFYGDAITIIYGTSSTGGTINVYDGPSSGTAVGTVSANGATSYSKLLDVTFATLATRTVTVKISGGTGTLIEQLVPHCGTLTQGVDVRETTRLGTNTAFFGDDTAAYASHGLDLTENWQPDLVISKLGQNDSTDALYAARTEALVDAIHARSPNSSVLIVVGPATLSNLTDGPVRIAAAEALLSGREDWLSVTSVYSQMGVIAASGPASLTRFNYNVGDSVHPSKTGALLMAQEIAGIVSGDPIGMAVRAPFHVAENSTVRWVGDVTGDVTGNVTGNVTGRLFPVTAEITASGVIDAAQLGYTLVYNGSTDITLTVDQYLIAKLFSSPTSTRLVQNGTGKIIIADGGGMTAVGDSSTSGPGTALTAIYSSQMGFNVLAVREGGSVATAGTATTLWSGTQTEYDDLPSYDPGTVYVVAP